MIKIYRFIRQQNKPKKSGKKVVDVEAGTILEAKKKIMEMGYEDMKFETIYVY